MPIGQERIEYMNQIAKRAYFALTVSLTLTAQSVKTGASNRA